MKFLRNEEGIALVTSLMFTVISLVISMALLYMVIAGTKTSGSLKRYKTALDATYGGTELFTKELIGKALDFQNYSSGTNSFNTYLTNEMGSLTNKSVSNCFKERLANPKRFWSAACTTVSNSSPDISFQLNAASGSPYRVFSNIVDTSEWKITSITGTGTSINTTLAGNSDPTNGGGGLSGATGLLTKGGAGYGQPSTQIPHYPYIYKIEVQGERQNNPMERGNVTVLYAY
jgi:hypothetical protein